MSPIEEVSQEEQEVDSGYKPQITTSDLQDYKGDNDLRGVTAAYEQGEGCPVLPGGLLGGRLSGVEADFSTCSLGPTRGFMSGCLGSNTPRISVLLFSDQEDWLGKSGTESEVQMDTVCLDVQESETSLHETQSCLSQGMAETTLTNGYFPQRYCQQHPMHIEG